MKTQMDSQIMKTKFSMVTKYVLMMGAVLALVSCSKDDDAKPDTRSLFVGSYAVEDVSASSGYVYEYDVTISNGDNGIVNISNFGDIFNVPVKGTVDGTKLTIKSQSFTNPSSGNTINVSGSGTLVGDILNFTYTTTGYLNYTGTCKASKKQ